MTNNCNKLWIPFLSYSGICFQNFRAISANQFSTVILLHWCFAEPVRIFNNSLYWRITTGKSSETRSSWLQWQTIHQLHCHSWSWVYGIIQPCGTTIVANVLKTIYHALTCANAFVARMKVKVKIINLTKKY